MYNSRSGQSTAYRGVSLGAARKRILFLTFYYPPDLCAGSFRAEALVQALKDVGDLGVEIEVLTTMPNRYRSYKKDALELEQQSGLTVRRIAVANHNSGFADQSRCFAAYARKVVEYTKGNNYDMVFATSSRLMTAALGARVSRRHRAKLYLDIRDLFIDTMSDVLSKPAGWLVLPIFRFIERYTFNSATVINLVSPGFQDYLKSFPCTAELRCFTNGIDSEFLGYDFSTKSSDDSRRMILYAGNIGTGQGLDRLIPDAAKTLKATHEFVIVGDGSAKDNLAEACKGQGNVSLLSPVGRDQLMEWYAKADILLVHLNDFEAFRKVLPSKIFEYAATGKPILAGVSGYAAEFTERYVENSTVFEPCNAQMMVEKLAGLDAALIERASFNSKFSRVNIMKEFAGDLVATLDMS